MNAETLAASAIRVPQAALARPVRQVLTGRSVSQEPKEQQVNRVPSASPVHRVPLVSRAPADFQELQDSPASREAPDCRAAQDRLEAWGPVGHPEFPVQPVQPVPLAQLASPAAARVDQPDVQEPLALWARLVTQDR